MEEEPDGEKMNEIEIFKDRSLNWLTKLIEREGS